MNEPEAQAPITGFFFGEPTAANVYDGSALVEVEIATGEKMETIFITAAEFHRINKTRIGVNRYNREDVTVTRYWRRDVNSPRYPGST